MPEHAQIQKPATAAGKAEGEHASSGPTMMGPDFSLQASSFAKPMQQKPASGEVIQKQDDATFEAGTGLTAALADGRMAADAINGTSYTVEVPGDYKVEFKIERAFKGIYPYASANKDVKGVYIKIEAHYTDLQKCGRCMNLQLMQVVRNVRAGTSGDIELANPGTATRRERSGWDDEDAASRGWRVDRTSRATDPIYSNGWSGENGNESSPAILWDAPGSWSNATNAGKEFHTSAVCTDAAGNKNIVGSISWGMMIDGSGNISFRPSPPTVMAGNPQETQDAAERWDSISGNTDTGVNF